jgi:hypothetical protein
MILVVGIAMLMIGILIGRMTPRTEPNFYDEPQPARCEDNDYWWNNGQAPEWNDSWKS